MDSYEIENNLRFLKFSKQLVFLYLVGEKAKENEWEKTHEPEKNLPSYWWEPQPVKRENGAVEKRILSGLLISGKNWVSKVKKTSLTKMAC